MKRRGPFVAHQNREAVLRMLDDGKKPGRHVTAIFYFWYIISVHNNTVLV